MRDQRQHQSYHFFTLGEHPVMSDGEGTRNITIRSTLRLNRHIGGHSMALTEKTLVEGGASPMLLSD